MGDGSLVAGLIKDRGDVLRAEEVPCSGRSMVFTGESDANNLADAALADQIGRSQNYFVASCNPFLESIVATIFFPIDGVDRRTI